MFFLFNPTQISLATSIITTVAVVMFGAYFISAFQKWEIDFSGSRVDRSDAKSPSNKQAPKVPRYVVQRRFLRENRTSWCYIFDNILMCHTPIVQSLSKTKEHVLAKSALHKAFKSCELIDQVKKMKERPLKRSARLREIAKRGAFDEQTCEEEDNADELHMDHIYIGFFDFLWGSIFIGPMSYLLWKKGTVWLSLNAVDKKCYSVKHTIQYTRVNTA